MITPKFNVDQTEDSIVIKIYAPFCRITDAEVSITDSIFTFYASPYYLRLSFSGLLVDSELEKHKITYDGNSNTFTFVCLKETEGEMFENLGMLTTLLTPKGKCKIAPCIEVVKAEGADVEDDTDIDWFIEQKLHEDNLYISENKYGFSNAYFGIFVSLRSELGGVVDVEDPDNKSFCDRRNERLINEVNLFSEEHYLGDYFEKECIKQYLMYEPHYYTMKHDEVLLSEDDNLQLLKLPRKEHHIDKVTLPFVYFSLVDILFCWCYNYRVSQGEYCTESAWNISKLSPTLSWLETFCSLKEVLVACIRRTLVFPLVRNWDLSMKLLEDTACIFSLGKKKVLKCFLEIEHLFNDDDPKYLLNQLFITDYCVWIQTINEKNLFVLADDIFKVKICKADVELDLEELEQAGHLALEESPMGIESNLSYELQGVSITESKKIIHSELVEPKTNIKSNIPDLNHKNCNDKNLDSDDDSG